MHALEDEPDEGNRLRRMGVGATVVLVPSAVAQRSIHRAACVKVIQMTVVAELPKLEKLPPPRTGHHHRRPARLRRRRVRQRRRLRPGPTSATPVVRARGRPRQRQLWPVDGASFHVGTTQMGEPVSVARAPAAGPVMAVPTVSPKLIPAGVPPRVERCRYNSRAQRLGLEGHPGHPGRD